MKGVRDSLGDYKRLLAEAKAVTGKELTETDREILQWGEAFGNVVDPIEKALDQIGGFFTGLGDAVKHPIETLKNLRKEIDGTADWEESLKRASEMQKRLADMKAKRADATQVNLTAIYDEELGKLKEQEASIKRIQALRSELANVENDRAQQQVEIAKQRGGDVALAEATALATQLRTGLQKLGGDLVVAKQESDLAAQTADAALVKYEQAIKDGVSPEKLQPLAKAVDDANKAAGDARQALSDQTQLFQERKLAFLEKTETNLNNLETETSAKATAASKAAFNAVYQTLKDEVEKEPSAAIAKITVADRDQPGHHEVSL